MRSQGEKKERGSVRLNHAIIETVMVSDCWVVQGLKGGLEFEGDPDELACDQDEVVGFVPFGPVQPELAFADSYGFCDRVEAVEEVFFANDSVGSLSKGSVVPMECERSVRVIDDQMVEVPFLEDFVNGFLVSFILAFAVNGGVVSHFLYSFRF